MKDITPFNRDREQTPGNGITEVLIASHQALIRDVLRTTLSLVDEARVIGEARLGDEALHAAEQLRPDAVIVDSNIGPDAEGIRTGYLLKAARPSTGIVVLAHGLEDDLIRDMTDRTGSGWSFISRSAAIEPRRLWRSIESAAAGNGFIDAGMERSAVTHSVPLLERLTVLQARALELLAAGISDAGIAGRLDLSERQAKTLIESLYADMHIDDGRRVDRRVLATLVYLRETVRLDN